MNRAGAVVGGGPASGFRPVRDEEDDGRAAGPAGPAGPSARVFAPRSTQQPLLALTLGLGRLFLGLAEGGGGAAGRQQYASLELRGGRLDVGPHLPLLAGRWRYTKSIGEGVSAQVVEVEDVYDSVVAGAPVGAAGDGGCRILVDGAASDDRAAQLRGAHRPGEEAPGTSERRALEARAAVGGGHKRIRMRGAGATGATRARSRAPGCASRGRPGRACSRL